jgi:hypothetical protein
MAKWLARDAGTGGSHVAFWDECAPGRFGDTGEWKLCKVARVDG